MMSTETACSYVNAFVWIWLPYSEVPVSAGVLQRHGDGLIFEYGQSYLAREDAIAIYAPELLLQSELIPLDSGLSMPSCLRDASPDAWGRNVLSRHRHGCCGNDGASTELDELTYLLESGSDRIGALDFQRSPTNYVSRSALHATLEDLASAVEQTNNGVLSAKLDVALKHRTAVGGARPKVLVEIDKRKFIAKFSRNSDAYNMVKAEFIAMRLAKEVGLNVASVQLTSALGKDVLLIERFDRICQPTDWHRRAMVSALTLLELDEMMAAYASYEKLAEIIRHRFVDPKNTLRELFSRIVFNILCGNTDDHARNHAAFWDGHHLALTPAYDICPQARAGQEATQAMLLNGNDRRSQLSACVAAAPIFMLGREDAICLINNQVAGIEQAWNTVCEEAKLSDVERIYFWRRQFLNPYAFYGAPDEVRALQC
jgi:serine/threonine-protein kinase HipA